MDLTGEARNEEKTDIDTHKKAGTGWAGVSEGETTALWKLRVLIIQS